MGVDLGIVQEVGCLVHLRRRAARPGPRQYLKDNPDLSDELEKKIKEKLGVGPRLDTADDAQDAAGGKEPPVDF
jgi:recombination protein RecA